MIKEWDDKYNSFNSDKGFAYLQWYEAILAGKFLPPIEASVDPVNNCNLDCIWCNGKEPKSRRVMMTREHLLELVAFFKAWGVKAMCVAGGGEPTMHPALGEAFRAAGQIGLPIALITNGLFINQQQINDIASVARWVGVSVDCANSETFEELKGADRFQEVCDNLVRLKRAGCREVTFKFLLHPKNQYQVYDACCLAEELGCDGIHIRPMSFLNYKKEVEWYDTEMIEKQVQDARRDVEIKIFSITHKFDNRTLHPIKPFKVCRATPIMPIFQADGWMTACIDQKHRKDLRLCRHDNPKDILKFWGSKKHKEIISKIVPRDCPKCTFLRYNEQIERFVLNDECDWKFT